MFTTDREELRVAGRTACDDVDGAAKRVRAEERRTGPKQHLDALDVVQRDGEIAVVMPGLGVVQTNAVEQHQRLTEASAADREIGLHVRTPGAHVNAGREPQHVFNRPNRQSGDVVPGQEPHRAPEAVERHRLRGAADDNRFVQARGLS